MSDSVEGNLCSVIVVSCVVNVFDVDGEMVVMLVSVVMNDD